MSFVFKFDECIDIAGSADRLKAHGNFLGNAISMALAKLPRRKSKTASLFINVRNHSDGHKFVFAQWMTLAEHSNLSREWNEMKSLGKCLAVHAQAVESSNDQTLRVIYVVDDMDLDISIVDCLKAHISWVGPCKKEAEGFEPVDATVGRNTCVSPFVYWSVTGRE
jgi:hypothetical protein